MDEPVFKLVEEVDEAPLNSSKASINRTQEEELFEYEEGDEEE